MRILFKNTEITKEIGRIDSSSYVMSYEVGDFIYVASDFPFNHLFIKMGAVKNAINANMKIEYYGSNQWEDAVELRDETNALKSDGFVEFTPNKDRGWSSEDSEDVGVTKVLYDKYWTRISFDVDLTESIAISYIGHKFSDDTDLFSEYPIFNDSGFLTSFQAGKTTWEEQHVKAADIIIQDLQKKNVIIAPEQILDRNKFIGAAVCKTAEIIYMAFGNDYLEQRRAAREEYSQRLNLSQYNVDANGDGILSKPEITTRQGWLSR